MKERHRYTDADLRKMEPEPQLRTVHITPGLFLNIYPTGRKLWRFRYGKQRVPLGEFPQVLIAEAKRAAEKAQQQRKTGVDPVIERRAGKRTVEAVALEWHAAKLAGTFGGKRPWGQTQADEVLRQLRKDVFPLIGNIMIESLTRPDVSRVVDTIAARSMLLAGKMRAWLEDVCDYGLPDGFANPARQARKHMPAMPAWEDGEEPHRPAIMELLPAQAMLRKIELAYATPSTKAANRFMALTALRPGEVRFLAWEEISFHDAVWNVPGPRMKMKRPHRVPLSLQALDVLDAMRRITGNHPYVFCSATDRSKPISHQGVGELMNRNGFKGIHCAHGWRTTFSTYLNENPPACLPLGLSIDNVVEAALAHRSKKNKTKRAYDRGDFFEARVPIMQEWADVLLAGALPLEEAMASPRHG